MIRNVLFDIGKVLLSFEREPTLREFARYSTTIDERDFVFGDVFVDGSLLGADGTGRTESA